MASKAESGAISLYLWGTAVALVALHTLQNAPAYTRQDLTTDKPPVDQPFKKAEVTKIIESPLVDKRKVFEDVKAVLKEHLKAQINPDFWRTLENMGDSLVNEAIYIDYKTKTQTLPNGSIVRVGSDYEQPEYILAFEYGQSKKALITYEPNLKDQRFGKLSYWGTPQGVIDVSSPEDGYISDGLIGILNSTVQGQVEAVLVEGEASIGKKQRFAAAKVRDARFIRDVGVNADGRVSINFQQIPTEKEIVERKMEKLQELKRGLEKSKTVIDKSSDFWKALDSVNEVNIHDVFKIGTDFQGDGKPLIDHYALMLPYGTKIAEVNYYPGVPSIIEYFVDEQGEMVKEGSNTRLLTPDEMLTIAQRRFPQEFRWIRDYNPQSGVASGGYPETEEYLVYLSKKGKVDIRFNPLV